MGCASPFLRLRSADFVQPRRPRLARELIPPVLFKYFPPERLDVLTRGRIRVSQRQAVNDPQDFHPPFVDAAPDDVLARVLEAQVANDPDVPAAARPALVRHMVSNYRDTMLQRVLANIRTPDLLGMVCLTDRPDVEAMWQKYAAGATGFVVGFDTSVLAGTYLPWLVVRRVRYTDMPIRFVYEGVPDLTAFYQKGLRWQEESEWRGTGVLSRFPIIGKDQNGLSIYVCTFPGSAVRTIYVREECTIANELSALVAIDARYRHVTLEQNAP